MGVERWGIELLIIYGCSSRSRILHLYGNVTIAGEGLVTTHFENITHFIFFSKCVKF
jgi:hypothetical protein